MLYDHDRHVGKFFVVIRMIINALFVIVVLWDVILVCMLDCYISGFVLYALLNIKTLFGVVTPVYGSSFYCGDATDDAQQKRSSTFCTCPLSITIFDDRYIHRIQMPSGCVSESSTSSWANEIKREAVVMDRLVSWFGGNTEKRETAPLAVITPSSPLTVPLPLSFSLSHPLSLSISFSRSLRISLLNSHPSMLGHRHRGGARCHVLGRREPSLGEQQAKAIHGRFSTVTLVYKKAYVHVCIQENKKTHIFTILQARRGIIFAGEN